MSNELRLFGADRVSSNFVSGGMRRQGAHVNGTTIAQALSAAISGEGGV